MAVCAVRSFESHLLGRQAIPTMLGCHNFHDFTLVELLRKHFMAFCHLIIYKKNSKIMTDTAPSKKLLHASYILCMMFDKRAPSFFVLGKAREGFKIYCHGDIQWHEWHNKRVFN